MKTSVLINNFNNGPYLWECVQSALAQSHPADEVIVYDDGSTDDSLQILRSFGSQIILIEGKRTSLPAHAAQGRAIHQAFLRSTGDVIHLLDGDDRFHPDKIAAYAEVFRRQSDVVLVQAPMQYIDENGRPFGSSYDAMKHQEDYRAATYRLNDVDLYYPTSSLAFARRFLEAVLPADFSDGMHLHIDTRLSMLAALHGRVVSLDPPLSDWRRHASSMSLPGRYGKSQLMETIKRTRVFNRYCRNHRLHPVSLWRCRRFYRQALRAAAPGFVFSFYYDHVRPARLPRQASTP